MTTNENLVLNLPYNEIYGWLAGFRKMAKIMSPSDVVSDFQQFLTDISGRYETE